MLPIPYEPQEGPHDCGAAALTMVWRSLDRSCTRAEVEQILRTLGGGAARARTHLLARAALDRGLHAVILRAAEPWKTLTTCVHHGLRAIVNHRAELLSPAGHYSVVVDIDPEQIILNDPRRGSGYSLNRPRFLSLWTASRPPSEVAGNVLVVFAPPSDDAAACQHCQTPLPGDFLCPWCRRRMPLRPAAALGCVAADCSARLWRCCWCPWCDLSFNRLNSDPLPRLSWPTWKHL